jgi:acetyl-CoA acyltransferase
MRGRGLHPAVADRSLADLTALDLGRIVVSELVQRSEIDPNEIDSVVFGQVIPGLTAASIAREVVLTSGLPRKIEAYTVARACATSVQAMVNAANAIALGQSDVAIAGGTESMSDPPIFTSCSPARASRTVSPRGGGACRCREPVRTR